MSAVIRGLAGDDNLSGTTGDDVFNLSLGGNDTVSGGQGNDIFWMGATLTAADKIDGGTGDDRVNLNGDYSGANAVTFAADTMVNVEHLYLAGGHSYTLTTDDATVAAGKKMSINAEALGASDHLVFDGSAETDGRFNIFAGQGDDTITGGARSDVFHLDTGGTDTLHAGGGDDWIYVGSTLGTFGHVDNIDGGTGFDTLFMDGTGDDAVIFGVNAVMTNVDCLVLGAGHSYTLVTDDATVAAGATLYVDGSALGASTPLTFDGSAETDGGFAIFAGAGNDTITGGQVGDYIDLSLGGNDSVTLGAGTNFVYMGAELTAADAIAGNGIFDIVELQGAYEGAHAVTFSATTMTGVEVLSLDRGFSYELTSNDATVASGADMTVDASYLGPLDSATFDGSAETDGTFTFYDGAGNDTFKGGAGADWFSFEAGGHDTGMGSGGDDYFDACGKFDSGDKFDGGSGYDIVELDASATPNFRYAFDHALNITADMLVNFEEMDLDGGGIYVISTADGVVASGVTFKIDATSFGSFDLLNFDGSAETDGSFAFYLDQGSYHLIGGAQNDTFYVGAGFAVNDRIDGGGSTTLSGNTIVFEGDYSFGFTFKPGGIANIQSLQFNGSFDYDFTLNDGNFASGVLATIDGSTVGALGSLKFDASHETDANLSFFDGAGDDELTGGTGQNNFFNMTGGGNDVVHTEFSFGGENHIYMFGNLTAADTIDAKGGFDEVQLEGDYTGAHALVFGATTMTGVDLLTLEGGHSYDLTTDDATVDSFLNPSLTVDSTNLLASDTLAFDGSAESDCNFVFNAGAETDTIVGGAFGDTFNMGANLTAADHIDGGGGIDELDLDGDYGFGLILGAATMTNVEIMRFATGHAYNITTNDGNIAAGHTLTVDSTALTGPTDSFVFDGQAETNGSFHFIVGSFADVFGGGGADTFDLQAADTVDASGGGGIDVFNFAANFKTADTIDGGTGSDTLALDGDYAALTLSGASISNMETVSFAAGHDYDVTLTGTVAVSGGRVILDASALQAGDDFTVDGSAATAGFILQGGGAGPVTATGTGFGDQFLLGAAFGADDAIDGGAGFDTLMLDGDYSSQLSITGAMLSNVEDIVALDGHSYNLKIADGGVVASGLVVDGNLLTGSNALTFDGSAETSGTFVVYTGAGDDNITGGSGTFGDQINLSGGNDTVHAGGGDDAILADASLNTADVIDGGTGYDTLVLNGDYSTQLDITNVASIEEIDLDSGHDYNLRITTDAVMAGVPVMTVNASSLAAANTLTFDGSAVTTNAFEVYDGAGDDDITTGGGGDQIHMSKGGADTVHAGGGGDQIEFGANLTASDTVDGGTGIDTLSLQGDYSAGLTFSATTMTNVETLVLFGAFDYKLTTDDATVASGQTLSVSAIGLDVGHKLTFDGSAETNGSFSITGSQGDDVVTGGALNDGFNFTQGGNDTGHGGAGNDTFSFGAAFTAADTLDGGANIDTISLNGDYSAGLTLGATTITSIENFVLAAGHDYKLTTVDANVASGATLTITATALGASNDLTFDGSAETDGKFTINAGAGDDDLTGGTGNDVFTLGGGINDVTGGAGADDITAGGSVDRFHYASAADSTSTTYDTIHALNAADDFFDLDVSPTQFDGTHDAGNAIDSGVTFDAQLALASTGFFVAGGALVVNAASGGTLAGHSFLIVDADGDGVYTGGTDYVFDITGYTGTLAIGNFI